MVMYIVPPYRPHRSLIGQPIIGAGSMSSFSTYSPSSAGSSPTSASSIRSIRTKSSDTYYPNGLFSSSAAHTRSSSRYHHQPCPPAYENRRLRRRDAFGIGETTPTTTPTTYATSAGTSSRRRGHEMPLERIPAVVREERRSRYDNYHANYDDEDDDDYYYHTRSRYDDLRDRDTGREYRYSRRRHGENRLRSFSEHARSSGRQDLIDLMAYALDEDDEVLSWTRDCRFLTNV